MLYELFMREQKQHKNIVKALELYNLADFIVEWKFINFTFLLNIKKKIN